MIVRRLVARQGKPAYSLRLSLCHCPVLTAPSRPGRNALAHAAPARQWRRFLASDVDVLERNETGPVDTPQAVPVYNPNAAREAALTDPTVVENWQAKKHLRTSSPSLLPLQPQN